MPSPCLTIPHFPGSKSLATSLPTIQGSSLCSNKDTTSGLGMESPLPREMVHSFPMGGLEFKIKERSLFREDGASTPMELHIFNSTKLKPFRWEQGKEMYRIFEKSREILNWRRKYSRGKTEFLDKGMLTNWDQVVIVFQSYISVQIPLIRIQSFPLLRKVYRHILE